MESWIRIEIKSSGEKKKVLYEHIGTGNGLGTLTDDDKARAQREHLIRWGIDNLGKLKE